jgi:hypothetical protein
VRLTRPGTLALIFGGCALLAWLAVRATFENLPLLPITAIPALSALAIAEAVMARNVRGRLTGARPGKPVAPIAVARLVALAKASSVGAAALGGLAAGYLAYVLELLDKPIPARDARVAGATLAAAIALLAAATYLERSCRDPNPPDDEDGSRDPREDWQWHS